MENDEILTALEKGFDYDKEKMISALMKLGILHWVKKSYKFQR